MFLLNYNWISFTLNINYDYYFTHKLTNSPKEKTITGCNQKQKPEAIPKETIILALFMTISLWALPFPSTYNRSAPPTCHASHIPCRMPFSRTHVRFHFQRHFGEWMTTPQSLTSRQTKESNKEMAVACSYPFFVSGGKWPRGGNGKTATGNGNRNMQKRFLACPVPMLLLVISGVSYAPAAPLARLMFF